MNGTVSYFKFLVLFNSIQAAHFGITEQNVPPMRPKNDFTPNVMWRKKKSSVSGEFWTNCWVTFSILKCCPFKGSSKFWTRYWFRTLSETVRAVNTTPWVCGVKLCLFYKCAQWDCAYSQWNHGEHPPKGEDKYFGKCLKMNSGSSPSLSIKKIWVKCIKLLSP